MPSVITPCGGGGGGGIQFDTSPQAGTWLFVETTGDAGSPNGYGLDLRNAERVGIFSANDSIDIEAPNGQVTLSSISGSGSGFLRLETDGTIDTEAALYRIDMTAGTSSFQVRDPHNHAALTVFGDTSMTFRLFDAFSQILFFAGGGAAIRIKQADSAVLMENLPVADPGVTGQLWNDANTVKVSP